MGAYELSYPDNKILCKLDRVPTPNKASCRALGIQDATRWILTYFSKRIMIIDCVTEKLRQFALDYAEIDIC